MNKKQFSEHILTQLLEKSKIYPTKEERVAFALGFSIGLLTELANKDSANYVHIERKIKSNGAT